MHLSTIKWVKLKCKDIWSFNHTYNIIPTDKHFSDSVINFRNFHLYIFFLLTIWFFTKIFWSWWSTFLIIYFLCFIFSYFCYILYFQLLPYYVLFFINLWLLFGLYFSIIGCYRWLFFYKRLCINWIHIRILNFFILFALFALFALFTFLLWFYQFEKSKWVLVV
jgi:hypothetical protein